MLVFRQLPPAGSFFLGTMSPSWGPTGPYHPHAGVRQLPHFWVSGPSRHPPPPFPFCFRLPFVCVTTPRMSFGLNLTACFSSIRSRFFRKFHAPPILRRPFALPSLPTVLLPYISVRRGSHPSPLTHLQSTSQSLSFLSFLRYQH